MKDQEVDENMELTIQIESIKGFENLEDILKEKRIHRIAFGPNDLAAEHGDRNGDDDNSVIVGIGFIRNLNSNK